MKPNSENSEGEARPPENVGNVIPMDFAPARVWGERKEHVREAIEHLAWVMDFRNSESDSEDFMYALFMAVDKTIIQAEQSHDEGLGLDCYSVMADELVEGPSDEDLREELSNE